MKYMKQRKWDAKLWNVSTIMKTVELTNNERNYIGPRWWYNPLMKEKQNVLIFVADTWIAYTSHEWILKTLQIKQKVNILVTWHEYLYQYNEFLNHFLMHAVLIIRRHFLSNGKLLLWYLLIQLHPFLQCTAFNVYTQITSYSRPFI